MVEICSEATKPKRMIFFSLQHDDDREECGNQLTKFVEIDMAILSLFNFGNSFDRGHERLGLYEIGRYIFERFELVDTIGPGITS
jgi:hypothetical protein